MGDGQGGVALILEEAENGAGHADGEADDVIGLGAGGVEGGKKGGREGVSDCSS